MITIPTNNNIHFILHEIHKNISILFTMVVMVVMDTNEWTYK